MLNIESKIEMLAKLIENDQIQGLKDSNCYCKGNLENSKVIVTKKRKYTNIDINNSGRYMVDNSTGEIYGIKGYGQVNKNHYYGTLDTICNYFWGRYTALILKESRVINFEELNTIEQELIDLGMKQFENEVINKVDDVEMIDIEKVETIEYKKEDSKTFIESQLEKDIAYLEANKDRIEENRKQWNYIIREVDHTIITNNIKHETIEYKKKGNFYVLTHKQNNKIIFTKLTNHIDSCMYITCMRDGDKYSNNWEQELEEEYKNNDYNLNDLLTAFNKCGEVTGDLQL